MAKAWTEAEDAVLRKLLPEHGPSWKGWETALPGRNKNAIQSRASRLGVKGPRASAGTSARAAGSDTAPMSAALDGSWTEEQCRLLVECAVHMQEVCGHSIQECAVALAELVKAYRIQTRRGNGDGSGE